LRQRWVGTVLAVVDTGESVQEQPENRAAAVSVSAALIAGIVASGSLWTTGAGFYMPLTFGWLVLVELSALTAIVSGHVARRQAKRHGLPGRWWALAAIVAGWLCAFYAVLVAVVAIGVFAGLAALFGALS
jgi:hypothetical protein